MGKRKTPIEQEPAYFDVLTKVALGRETPTSIRSYFDDPKTTSTIHEQLQGLVKLKFVNYDSVNIKYTINYPAIVDYYTKTTKIPKQTLVEKLPTWMEVIGATPLSIGMSIHGFGEMIKFLSIPKTL